MKKALVIVMVWACMAGYQCQNANPCQGFPDLGISPNQSLHDWLRPDGYYYEVVTDTPQSGRVLTEMVILYQNGVAIAGGSFEVSSLMELDEAVGSIDNNGLYRESRDFWGIFSSDSQNIAIAHWGPRSCGKYGIRREGQVQNETTFVLTSQTDIDDNAPFSVEPEVFRRYHFRGFSPKPHSTNDFVP